MKRFLVSLLCLLSLSARAEDSPRPGDGLWYWATARGSLSSGDNAPFWFTANQKGLATPNTESGLIDIGLSTFQPRPFTKKSEDWRLGYGLEVATPFGMDSHFVLQQLYAEMEWKNLRLGVGQKVRPLELKNNMLSTGGMTTGINARPLPQVRLEVPRFVDIPGTKHWLAVKGHLAYGWYTDNGWQREFTRGSMTKYTANSLYHSKAGFLRIGNRDKFPLTLTGGIEMSSQFGGEAWNLMRSLNSEGGGTTYNEKIASGLKAYWHAFVPGGSDSNDGDFNNRSGNLLGSWHARLDYYNPSSINNQETRASIYMEHFFDDQSQLFMQYAWKDMLVGVELNPPFRPYIDALVLEFLFTKDQSGPIYHDATPTLPEQISAVDEYYNNHIYGAWQHAGFVMGNPLLLSPIYNFNDRNEIYAFHNRIKALHVGLNGAATSYLDWKFMLSHEESWGTYQRPLIDPQKGTYLLAGLSYKVHHVDGLRIDLSYGHNHGHLLGRSNGAMLTVIYSNPLNPKRP